MNTFASLKLIAPLQRAIAGAMYEIPTPIQAQAIPPLLAGRDVLGCAQTGTGKTAAFALPVLQHLAQAPRRRGKARIRALVLTPTRELAAQIGDSFAIYGRFLPISQLVIFGGVNESPQIAALRRGIDVLVATPGRLLDLHGRGFIDLGDIEFFVLDEADRMLDMGFIHDVRRILAHLPGKRQNLLFSATMPPAIVKLAATFLRDPVRVEVTPHASTVELIEQTVMFVDTPNKKYLLAELLQQSQVERSIVFTRTKHGANRLTKQLGRVHINAVAIHGNKSQAARRRALEGFRNGDLTVLVATDIAARGIDIDGVSHVFNYDLPNEPEVYVHRIGRTGRAGRTGSAVSFCDASETGYLRAIERTIGLRIPINTEHDFHFAEAMPQPGRSKSQALSRATPARATGAAAPRGPRTNSRSRGRYNDGRGRPRADTPAPAAPRSAPTPSPKPVASPAAKPAPTAARSSATKTAQRKATPTAPTTPQSKSRPAAQSGPKPAVRGPRRRLRGAAQRARNDSNIGRPDGQTSGKQDSSDKTKRGDRNQSQGRRGDSDNARRRVGKPASTSARGRKPSRSRH